jgi:hypothetical protein
MELKIDADANADAGVEVGLHDSHDVCYEDNIYNILAV